MQSAHDMLTDFFQSVEISSIDTAIDVHRKALRLQTSSVPSRTLMLSAFAEALVIRYQIADETKYLDEAIGSLRKALQLLPPPDPTRFRVMLHHCACLLIRF